MLFSRLSIHPELSRVNRRLSAVFRVFRDFDDSYAFGSEPFFPLLTPQLHLLQKFDSDSRSTCQGECACATPGTQSKAATTPAAVPLPSQQKTSLPEQKQAMPANNERAVSGPSTSIQQPPQQTNSNSNSNSIGLRPWGALFPSFRSAFIPRLDVVENSDHFLVKCELPGISKQDVKLSLSADGLLSIAVEHSDKQEQKDENSKLQRVERSYEKFQRAIQLPDNVDADAVKASQENGMLQITLPKKLKQEPKQGKQIHID